MKIGLTWAGNPSHTNDRRRSCSLRDLAPLAAALPTATFVSLQKGPAAIQSRDASSPFRLLDLTDSLNDFADTAALIANLDMVISVDTAVAHLSGALAKPTCLLLPQVPDWRWLRDRADSPWYPTMTLFRQEKPDDWTFPIQQLAANLREFPSGEPSCA
jgi:ADP-heptose:LPS heptosyltransferase